MGKSRQQDQNHMGVENTSHSEICNPDVDTDTNDYRQVLQNIRQERADGAPDNQESNSCHSQDKSFPDQSMAEQLSQLSVEELEITTNEVVDANVVNPSLAVVQSVI